MSTAAFEEILAERERRARFREELIIEHRRPVITFTLNLAGSEKRSLLSDFAFYCGEDMLKERLGKPVFYRHFAAPAGLCSFFVYSERAAVLKKICMELEESEIGRIFDFDVSDEHGCGLFRSVPRKCLLCSAPAAECARSRAHPLEQVQKKTNTILEKFAAEHLSAKARLALLEELDLTPKPGLVDKNGSGAHSDMSYSLFCKSADALLPYFEHAVLIGLGGGGLAPLEREGLFAEEAMLSATGGINTHKGAIFLFGLLLYGCGRYLSCGENPFSAAAALAAEKEPAKGTHGEKARLEHGAFGALGEAVFGFPTVKSAARSLCCGKNPLRVFFEIMEKTDDTNVLFRGGDEALRFVKQSAENALFLSDGELFSESARLDGEFIRRNISPGGCADIFALSVFSAKNLSPKLFENGVSLRKAVPKDLSEIKNVFSAIIKKMAAEGNSIWDEFYPCEFFAADIAEKRLYLLEEDGKIISAFVLEKSSDGEDCVLWKNPSARAFYLMRFGVNPEYTGRGFGVLSLQYAKKIAKLLCGEYLRLFVAEKNIPAIRLYEKCGFSPAGGIFQNEIAPGEFLPELGYELYLE